MQRFLQAQNIVNPLAYIAVLVFLVHVLLTWLVVDVLEYGLLGAALAQSASWWLLVIAQGLYIIFSPLCNETWTGFSLDAIKSIWPYFKLTVASAVMLCLEIWYFQGLVLASGLLPNATISLDSISVCMNYWNWDMQFMLGLAAAASVRVSNELGAGHPRVAKFSVIIVSMTSFLFSTALCIVVLIFRVGLSKLFTSDTKVLEAISKLTPLLGISVWLNGIQPIPSGVAVGSGSIHQSSYLLFDWPPNWMYSWLQNEFASSRNMVGDDCWSYPTNIHLFILTARTNWNTEVAKAAARLKEAGNPESEHLADTDFLLQIH